MPISNASTSKPQQKPTKTKSQQLKELEINTTIGPHDLDVKLKKALRVFDKNNLLKITIVDRRGGRPSVGLLADIVERLSDVSVLSGDPIAIDKKLTARFHPKPRNKST
jgi:translation initiation factor IF-3